MKAYLSPAPTATTLAMVPAKISVKAPQDRWRPAAQIEHSLRKLIEPPARSDKYIRECFKRRVLPFDTFHQSQLKFHAFSNPRPIF
jgi:hypothetical protein